jgi:hypothetical protein
MVSKHYCDRCGSEGDVQFGIRIMGQSTRSDVNSTMDLCDECWKELNDMVAEWRRGPGPVIRPRLVP